MGKGNAAIRFGHRPTGEKPGSELTSASGGTHRGAIRRTFISAAVGMAVAAGSSSAAADAITFNFNSLGEGNLSAAIATYLTSALGSAVTVSGAKATKSYNGDGHVRYGRTLGTSDGATGSSDTTHDHALPKDTFIINNGPGSNQFTFNFGTFLIFGVSFDWEIFPDASCTTASCTPGSAHWPDFTLLADGSAVWSKQGTGANGAALPQDIGVSGLIDFASGVHSLTFRDWPAEIGIDNLTIYYCAATEPRCLRKDAPEPSSLPLAGAALALAGLALRRRAPRRS